jgi:hypothetical protein
MNSLRRDPVLRLVANLRRSAPSGTQVMFPLLRPSLKHLRRSAPAFRYKRYQIDDGRHRGDTERTYGGIV